MFLLETGNQVSLIVLAHEWFSLNYLIRLLIIFTNVTLIVFSKCYQFLNSDGFRCYFLTCVFVFINLNLKVNQWTISDSNFDFPLILS